MLQEGSWIENHTRMELWCVGKTWQKCQNCFHQLLERLPMIPNLSLSGQPLLMGHSTGFKLIMIPGSETPEVDETPDPGVLTFSSPELRMESSTGGPGAQCDWCSGCVERPWTFVVDTQAPTALKLNRPINNALERGNPTFSWKKARTAVWYQFEIDDSPDFRRWNTLRHHFRS